MDGQPVPLPAGTPAPDFTLPRSSRASVSLADVRGRRVILVFYPTDWASVSGQQLPLYQDQLAAFARIGAVLLASSTDHVWCHGAFARAAGIHYPLLADDDGVLGHGLTHRVMLLSRRADGSIQSTLEMTTADPRLHERWTKGADYTVTFERLG